MGKSLTGYIDRYELGRMVCCVCTGEEYYPPRIFNSKLRKQIVQDNITLTEIAKYLKTSLYSISNRLSQKELTQEEQADIVEAVKKLKQRKQEDI